MKKTPLYIPPLVFLILTLGGCNSIGDKATSMSIIYSITAVFSLLMLFCYLLFIKKRNIWFIFLFSSIFIVNIGYYLLSISSTLDFALWANRIAYLGSVFLPLSMLMIIVNVSKLQYHRWFPCLLAIISTVVFLIAASPGFLDIYYKSVSLEFINGVAVLDKEYGPWHIVYLFYLLGYFSAIVCVTIIAAIKKKIESTAHVIILAFSVFLNICVWLLEQLVKIDFEFLSVSYIISGFFLIGLHLIIENQSQLIGNLESNATTTTEVPVETESELINGCIFLEEHLYLLTATERSIYNHYLDGKSTKEIMAALSITENTLKFHNKNIYSKLGVRSRKQLIEYAKHIKKES